MTKVKAPKKITPEDIGGKRIEYGWEYEARLGILMDKYNQLIDSLISAGVLTP